MMAKYWTKQAEENLKLEHGLIELRVAVVTVNSHEFSGTDSVIFAGPTKAGKSTIISSLLGISFEAGEEDGGTVHLTKKDSKGPTIGKDDISETYVPENWGKLGGSELVMWDFPGFGDNRGEIQEITNAAFYEKVLITQESVRVVLVVPIAFCSQALASRLNTLLDEAKSFCKEPSKSLCLVVTQNNTSSRAIKSLESRTKTKGVLSDENKALLEDLIKDGKVIEFKTPTEPTVTFEEEKTKLEQCVLRLKGTRVEDISLVMSDSAKLFLHKVYHFVLQKHNKDIQQTVKLWDGLFYAKVDEIGMLTLEYRYDRYKQLERNIDGIKHDMSVNPTDMRDDIWSIFGGQRTDLGGSKDYGGLIHLPTLLFLEVLMNKHNKTPVHNANTTSVILGQYVVDKVLELQRIAEIIKAPTEEEKERIERSKQEREALKSQLELIERLKEEIETLKQQLEEMEKKKDGGDSSCVIL